MGKAPARASDPAEAGHHDVSGKSAQVAAESFQLKENLGAEKLNLRPTSDPPYPLAKNLESHNLRVYCLIGPQEDLHGTHFDLEIIYASIRNF